MTIVGPFDGMAFHVNQNARMKQIRVSHHMRDSKMIAVVDRISSISAFGNDEATGVIEGSTTFGSCSFAVGLVSGELMSVTDRDQE